VAQVLGVESAGVPRVPLQDKGSSYVNEDTVH
jgi:hypothetical protein